VREAAEVGEGDDEQPRIERGDLGACLHRRAASACRLPGTRSEGGLFDKSSIAP
jgi:hypothetical protein